MKTFYSSAYTVELPEGHRFPMEKYGHIRRELPRRSGLPEAWIAESPEIPRSEAIRAHTASYVDAFVAGELDRRHMRRIGFPWSEGLVGRILTTVGGTWAATHAALDEGIASNLAGGTHHAGADFGEGFCVFNDIAIAALSVLEQGLVERVAVVDLDVHQGNGTAQIMGSRADTFLLSVHGEKNYPFVKTVSDIDVGVIDGTSDERFLDLVQGVLGAVERFAPDLVFYQAGVDVIAADTLGRLSMSHDGVEARDHLVFERVRKMGVPLVLVLGGGYADPIDETVEAHVRTYRSLNRVFELW